MVLTATVLLQCLMSFAIFAPLVMAPAVLDTLGRISKPGSGFSRRTPPGLYGFN